MPDGVGVGIGERLTHQSDDYDPFVIRTPLQLDKPTGALFFPGGGLTEGRAIQFTRRDPDKIRASAQGFIALLTYGVDVFTVLDPEGVLQPGEEKLVRIYQMSGVKPAGLRKAWGALRGMFGHRVGNQAPLAS